MKFLLPFLLLFAFIPSKAQKIHHVYSAEIFLRNTSKEVRGILTEANDSTIKINNKKGFQKIPYTNIKSIKFFKLKRYGFSFYPTIAGLGYIISSPFQSSLKNGIKNAGIGVAIIFLAASIEVTFRKTCKVTIRDSSTTKNDLQPFVYKRMEAIN